MSIALDLLPSLGTFASLYEDLVGSVLISPIGPIEDLSFIQGIYILYLDLLSPYML